MAPPVFPPRKSKPKTWSGTCEGFAIDASVIEADASRDHRVEVKLTTLPDDDKATRPVREYLSALDEAAPETATTVDEDDDAPPGKPPSEPKFTSLKDPATAWTNKGQMKAVFAYGANYLIDTKEAVIVDVEATPARRSAEVAATKMRTRGKLRPAQQFYTLAA